MHDFPIEKKVSQLQSISYLFLMVLSFIVLFVVIEGTNQNRFIEDLVKQIIDNKGSIEDVNTKISNIDPVDSLISQGEETEPGHHSFNYIESGVMMTGVVLDISLIDMEEVTRGGR